MPWLSSLFTNEQILPSDLILSVYCYSLVEALCEISFAICKANLRANLRASYGSLTINTMDRCFVEIICADKETYGLYPLSLQHEQYTKPEFDASKKLTSLKSLLNELKVKLDTDNFMSQRPDPNTRALDDQRIIGSIVGWWLIWTRSVLWGNE